MKHSNEVIKIFLSESMLALRNFFLFDVIWQIQKPNYILRLFSFFFSIALIGHQG